MSEPANQTIRDMIERRSCRSFRPDMVPHETVEKIIGAGLYAASGMGRQSPIIVAVTDRTLRDRLSESNRKIGGWKEGFDPFYGAPVVLIVLADKSRPTA
ncbi:MAG: nitroreductase family protein, partial [Succinivibrionaceae bacterium]|nr:nitroreductase family protein [Succinivibrionaceae bacterium]